MENSITFVQDILAIQELAKKSKILAKVQFDPKLKEKYDKAIADAKPIIDNIKSLAQLAAADNQDGCPIMFLKEGVDEFFSDYTSIKTRKLEGSDDMPADMLGVTAKAVFDFCKNDLKIDARVKHGVTSYDEQGETFYKIWICWKPKATARSL